MERAPKQVEPGGGGYVCFQSSGVEEWAALLVVSESGLPQEFLYSGPLRATPVQAILYQEQLAPQTRLSLVRSLLRGLRSRPTFLAFRAQDLDPVLLEELKTPIFLLHPDSAAWVSEPTPSAEAARLGLEDTVGVSEPLGRTIAALAYVIEYERRSPPEEDAREPPP